MIGKGGLTEHLATISNVSAGDSKRVDIVLNIGVKRYFALGVKGNIHSVKHYFKV